MNILYAKAVLYAYPCMDAITEQIDDLVEKKALASMRDFSPCEEQCEKILKLTRQKCTYILLKDKVDNILKSFTSDEHVLLDYKYFHKGKREDYANYDFASRNYFRKQIRVANKFAKKLENLGIDDNWIEKNCLENNFFVELIKRVKEHEQKSQKNKSHQNKTNAINGGAIKNSAILNAKIEKEDNKQKSA